MTENGTFFDSATRRRLQSAVLRWYDQHGRILPWRASADPYRVWLSEIMLQQTTVVAVVPYFNRFTAKFPDVQSLAAADVDNVLRLWEGLGYYSRARNLHKAARVILAEHNGQFPTDPVILQTLPGIGRYTAGAIASFAFNQSAAILEANTERLYARLTALREDARSTASQRSLWQFADSIVPKKRPGDFNQSLMDIGSQICRPQGPDCGNCPLLTLCKAAQLGLQHELPIRKARVAITAVTEVGLAIHSKGRYLLRRRTESERWAGMWDFVRFEIDESAVAQLPFSSPQSGRRTKSGGAVSQRSKSLFTASGEKIPDLLQNKVLDQVGCKVGRVSASTEITYSVTRYRVRLICFACESQGAAPVQSPERRWVSKSEMAELPLSKTGREIAKWLKTLCDE